MQPTTIAAALMASAVVLMSSTPPAHADSQDDTYLNELGGHGITNYPSDTLIKVGHRCARTNPSAQRRGRRRMA